MINDKIKNPYSALRSVFLRFCRVIWVSVLRYSRDGHSDRAVALTYYTLFSIVPVAALLFGVAKGFDLENRLRQVLSERLSQHDELLKWLYQFVDTTLAQASGGVVAGIGVIALLWTVSWLAASVEGSFNAVWERPGRRNIIRKVSDYLSVMLVLPILLVAMSSAGVVLRNVLDDFSVKVPHFGETVTFIVSALVTLTPLVVTILLFTAMYFFAPTARVRFRSALLAGVISGVFFQLLQDSFFYLQKSIFNYNRVYGSFAALPLFLTWLKLSWQLTLFGAEIGFVDQNIDTGKFDMSPMENSSISGRNTRRLAFAGYAYSRFSKNLGATSREQYLSRFGLTPVETDIELDFLVSAGILLKIEDADDSVSGYTPARNVATFTASDCLDMIEHAGVQQSQSMPEASHVIHSFEAVRKGSDGDTLLSSIY